MSRVYAIGDIHGAGDKLKVALSQLSERVRPYDTVVFLGDYIDRGPDSAGVVEQLLRFKKKHRSTVFLRGNHEDLFMDAYMSTDSGTEMQWLMNGGQTTLASFKIQGRPDWRRRLPRWFLEFISDTAMEHLSERYHFVHAGILPPGVDTGLEPDQDVRLWIREPFINSNFSHSRVVVFGHTVMRDGKPLVHPNKVGIDTGACIPGGRLTVACFNYLRSRVNMPQFDYFQVLDNGSVYEQEFYQEEPVMVAGPQVTPIPPQPQPQPLPEPARQPGALKRSPFFWQPKTQQS